jgi:chorismate synthase
VELLLRNLFRPGHADYTYFVKYGNRDFRGGGRASARETIARVAAGAIAKLILSRIGLKIIGYTKQVGDIEAKEFDYQEIEKNPMRCPDKKAANEMVKRILAIAKKGDSIGGLVEVIAEGVPPGLGEPVFDKLDAQIAMGMMSIGAVKGVEIGCGFKVVNMLGSENNDEFINLDGNISTKSNHAGGILGGISNGGDLVIRLAVKPPSSIFKTQTTVDEKGKKKKIQVEGRHDPCICPRIVPVAEAMLALVLVDNYLLSKTNKLEGIN